MFRPKLFFRGIPFKIMLVATIVAMVSFAFYDMHMSDTSETYDSFDSHLFVAGSTFICNILCALMSTLASQNKDIEIRQKPYLSASMFYLPLIVYLPVLFLFGFSSLAGIYWSIVLAIGLLQTYNLKRMKRGFSNCKTNEE